eukprot:s4086_g12.t1
MSRNTVADRVLVPPHFEVKFVALAREASALPALSMRCCMKYTCPNMVVRQCVGAVKGKAVLPGLDPTVVGAARQAGIPEDQLRRLGDLAMTGAGARAKKPLAAQPKARPQDALDESEDDVEGASPEGVRSRAQDSGWDAEGPREEQRPRAASRSRRWSRRGEGASGLGAARSKAEAYQKLRQEGTACSARGWIEHRSHLQQYAGPIRSAWLLGGIVDAINAGSPEQAKSMALLDIASLDQASIDVQSV